MLSATHSYWQNHLPKLSQRYNIALLSLRTKVHSTSSPDWSKSSDQLAFHTLRHSQEMLSPRGLRRIRSVNSKVSELCFCRQRLPCILTRTGISYLIGHHYILYPRPRMALHTPCNPSIATPTYSTTQTQHHLIVIFRAPPYFPLHRTMGISHIVIPVSIAQKNC